MSTGFSAEISAAADHGVLVDWENLANQIFCDLVNARGMEITFTNRHLD